MNCQIQLWEQSVARSPRYQCPTPPSTKLKDLNFAVRAKVQQLYLTRDWEACDSCGRLGTYFVLKKCAGCGIFGFRALYCNRTCQQREWPIHKQLCGPVGLACLRQLRIGSVDNIQALRNHSRSTAKRMEGLGYIMKWAFEEVWLANPTIDPGTTCFSIYAYSSNGGRGRIYIDAFQLQRLDTMPYGPENLAYMKRLGTTMGVIYLFLDGFYHPPQRVELESARGLEPRLRQWLWIVATITTMRHHNAELGMIRLGTLAQSVRMLVKHEKDEMHKFEVPLDLGNGEPWEMHSFDRWQALFGKVVKFEKGLGYAKLGKSLCIVIYEHTYIYYDPDALSPLRESPYCAAVVTPAFGFHGS